MYNRGVRKNIMDVSLRIFSRCSHRFKNLVIQVNFRGPDIIFVSTNLLGYGLPKIGKK